MSIIKINNVCARTRHGTDHIYKAPCKRTQHVGATSPDIVGIISVDVGLRVFKRSQHVGQCCFYGNTEGESEFDIYQNLFAKLQSCGVQSGP